VIHAKTVTVTRHFEIKTSLLRWQKTSVFDYGADDVIFYNVSCRCSLKNMCLVLDICQLRLDLDDFVINQPDNDGLCADTLAVTSPTLFSPPIVCGTLTGQHSKYLHISFDLLLRILNSSSTNNIPNLPQNQKSS
jgi:hypothetical protein